MVTMLILTVALTGFGPWVSVGPEGGDVDAPVQSPSNPLELWALSGSNPTQVVHSDDGGATWEPISSFTGSTVYDMTICPDGRLVAGGSSRVWTSTDGGYTWNSSYSSNTIFYDVEAHPVSSSHVYAGGYAYDGAWKIAFMHSTDGGATFSVTHIPLSGTYDFSYGRCIAVSQSSPSNIIVGGYGYSSTDATYQPLLMISTDGGVNFTDITPPEASAQYYMYGAAFHPSDPNTILAGSLYSMYRSTNGGASWTKVAANQTYNYGIRFSQADDDLVMAAGMNRIYRSTNGGVTWSQVYTPFSGLSGIQWVIPDWSSASNAFASSSGGFHSSSDGGVNWSQSNEGLLVGRVLAMEESQGWVFMNMLDMGLFRTPSTGSVNWEEVTTPLSCGDFCSIKSDGAGTLLALEGSG